MNDPLTLQISNNRKLYIDKINNSIQLSELNLSEKSVDAQQQQIIFRFALGMTASSFPAAPTPIEVTLTSSVKFQRFFHSCFSSSPAMDSKKSYLAVDLERATG